MKINSNKVTAVLLITILFLSTLGMFNNVYKRYKSSREIKTNNDLSIKEENTIPETENANNNESLSSSGSSLVRLYNYYTTTLKKIDQKSADYVALKNEFIKMNGLLQKSMGKKTVNDLDTDNTVTKLNNGYLTFTAEKIETAKVSDNLISFNNYLKEKSIPLLYVQAPAKISKYDNKLPIGVEDYLNLNADNFLSQISKSKVDFIDIREKMHSENIDQYELFFKTDHHWKPEGAFYAFQKVAEKLNNDYDFNIDSQYTDFNNYDIKTYKDWFLGSQGKRVGPSYAGVDDISLIYPKFKTDLVFEVPSKQLVKKGSYLESIIDYSKVEQKDLWNNNPYAMYTGGDYPLNIIKNNTIKDKKILLLRDSFGCAFAPFLSMACNELDIIDLRYYNSENLKEYISKTNPDIVLFLYNPGMLGNEAMFKFN
jgi:hypothetical protein